MIEVTLHPTWGEVVPAYPPSLLISNDKLSGPIEKTETPRSQCFLSVSVAVGGYEGEVLFQLLPPKKSTIVFSPKDEPYLRDVPICRSLRR